MSSWPFALPLPLKAPKDASDSSARNLEFFEFRAFSRSNSNTYTTCWRYGDAHGPSDRLFLSPCKSVGGGHLESLRLQGAQGPSSASRVVQEWRRLLWSKSPFPWDDLGCDSILSSSS